MCIRDRMSVVLIIALARSITVLMAKTCLLYTSFPGIRPFPRPRARLALLSGLGAEEVYHAAVAAGAVLLLSLIHI